MRKIRFTLLLAVVLLLGQVSLPLPYLSVTDGDGQVVLQPFIGLEGRFTLAYRHSVQKTLCWEDFEVRKNGEIVLVATRYESLGVGLPFLVGEGQLTNNQGQFHLTGLDRHFPSLALRAMPIAEQALIVGERIYKFNDFFAPGAMIEIRARRLSLFQVLSYKLSKGEG